MMTGASVIYNYQSFSLSLSRAGAIRLITFRSVYLLRSFSR